MIKIYKHGVKVNPSRIILDISGKDHELKEARLTLVFDSRLTTLRDEFILTTYEDRPFIAISISRNNNEEIVTCSPMVKKDNAQQ